MPALRSYWYEGFKQGAEIKPTRKGKVNAATGNDRNFPPLLLELQKQYPDEEMDKPDSGTLYVGEKGVIYTATYGGRMHVVPMEKKVKEPDRYLPRPKAIMTDFLNACREGRKETYASFDYGARLTEFALLGNLAQHAGLGNKIEWDGPNMKVKNLKDLNGWIKRPYRKGWSA
jgi:hypothetical protein